MIVTLESTSKIVQLVVDGKSIPARLWQVHTANGVACHAFVTRVAVDKDENAAEFEKDLQEQAVPRAEFISYPLRLIL